MSEPKPIRLCAWCKAVLTDADSPRNSTPEERAKIDSNHRNITHGICVVCAQTFKSRRKKK